MDSGDGEAQASDAGPASSFKAYFDFLADVDDDGFVGEETIIRRVADTDVIMERPKQPKVLKERYLVDHALGDGAYAKVKACRDLETGENLAVKIIAMRPLRKMRDSRRQVEQECTIMRTVAHENVVRLRDDFYDAHKDKRYFFMDLCLGSVHDLQARGLPITAPTFRRLPELQARCYFRQLVSGLAHLHECRIVHKDMKPGNLLLTREDCLKITDFGVSEQLPADAVDDLITSDQGTPAILPPEVAGGHVTSFSGFKVDVYGAGVCLFFMLLGRVPYRDANVMRILQLIDEGQLEVPEDEVGAEARRLILKLMVRDPAERPFIAEVAGDAWLSARECERPEDPEERESLGWLEPHAFLGDEREALESAFRKLRLRKEDEARGEEAIERRRGLNSLGIFDAEPELQADPAVVLVPCAPCPAELPPRVTADEPEEASGATAAGSSESGRSKRGRSGSRSKRPAFLSSCRLS